MKKVALITLLLLALSLTACYTPPIRKGYVVNRGEVPEQYVTTHVESGWGYYQLYVPHHWAIQLSSCWPDKASCAHNWIGTDQTLHDTLLDGQYVNFEN